MINRRIHEGIAPEKKEKSEKDKDMHIMAGGGDDLEWFMQSYLALLPQAGEQANIVFWEQELLNDIDSEHIR